MQIALKIRLIVSLFIILLSPINSDLYARNNEIRVDSVGVKEGFLVVSFSIQDLFTDRVLESMNKGVSVSIQYEISLWRKRSSWFDKNVTSTTLYFKVKYNKFDRRYIWQSVNERRTTASLIKIHRLCAEQTEAPVTFSSEIESENSYYITVKGILKPTAIEDLNDVKNWLRGEIKEINLDELNDPKKSGKKITSGLFNAFKELAGFGDKIYTGTSFDFTIGPDGKIIIIPD